MNNVGYSPNVFLGTFQSAQELKLSCYEHNLSGKSMMIAITKGNWIVQG